MARKAKREGWRSQPRQGRGGGLEYHFDSLPPEAQAALLRAQIAGGPESSLELNEEISAIAETTDVESLAAGFDSAQPALSDVAAKAGAGQAPAPAPVSEDFGGMPSKAVGVGIERAETPIFPTVSSGAAGLAAARPAGDLSIVDRVAVPMERPASKDEAKIHAKLEILRAQQVHCAGREIGTVDCEYEFCDLYNQGRIEVAPWVRDVVRRLGRSTLRRWQKSVKGGDLLGLGDARQGRPGTMIDGEPMIRQFIINLIAKEAVQTVEDRGGRMAVKVQHIHRALHARFPVNNGWELPSLPTLRRWVERWVLENRSTVAMLRSPDDWKNRYMPAFGSYSEGIERVNQLWELDSTPADVALEVNGRMVRHHLVGCIDVFSRRGKLLLVPTSKAAAIAALVRACLLDWGIPEAVKTDNGSDYKSLYMQQVFATLGVEQRFCTPYSPEQKPHIERFLGTFSHGLAAHLPGYLGHNVAARKALESQRSFADRLGRADLLEVPLPAHEFQAFVQSWCEDYYPNQAHEGLGMSPNERAAGAQVRLLENPRVLDLLLAEGKEASVQKKGIRLAGRHYIAAELADRIREKVHVRYTDDAGKVAVFADPYCKSFICVAECPELTGLSRKAVAMAAKAIAGQQKRRVSALKAAAREMGLEDVPREILEAAKPAEPSPLAPLPGGEGNGTRPVLRAPLPGGEGAEAALDALLGRGAPAPKALTAADLEMRDLLAAEAAEAEAIALRPVADPVAEFYRIWKWKVHGVGEAPSEEDERRWERIERIPSEWRKLSAIAESRWEFEQPGRAKEA